MDGVRGLDYGTWTACQVGYFGYKDKNKKLKFLFLDVFSFFVLKLFIIRKKKYNLVEISCYSFPAVYSDYKMLNLEHNYIKI